MEIPVQITFRHLQHSDAAEERIREEAAKLDRYFDRITSCRVLIEAPHHHRERGESYHVRIEIGVPGKELVVSHDPGTGKDAAHKDLYIAIRDSFHTARRQLEDYARKLRGDVKSHGEA